MELTLENFRKVLTSYYGFEIEYGKSLNIEYRMDEEGVLFCLRHVADMLDLDLASLEMQFNYTLYFKDVFFRAMENHVRRLFGCSYDRDFYREEIPLTIEDIYDLFKECPKRGNRAQERRPE